MSAAAADYAVIDVETTGLYPHEDDRIIELAVVHVSARGEVGDSWVTLVNPKRDLGPTQVHGITPREVLAAPTFAQVAPYLVEAIRGRTIVAHNAPFDLLFVESELRRAGIALGPEPLRGLCTMQWSRHFLSGASRSLVTACEEAGIDVSQANSALGDAHATALLLGHFLWRARLRAPWQEFADAASARPWPAVEADLEQPPFVTRGSAPTPVVSDAWLERMVARMPRQGDVRIESYLEVLEHALLDRYVSNHEQQAMGRLAEALGLERDEVTASHAAYLEGLAAAVWADGVVEEAERSDLDHVASLLGLPRRTVDSALAVAGARHGYAGKHGRFALLPGDRVVFTGPTKRTRGDWEGAVAAAGLDLGPVTARTKVVVSADPDVTSDKANAAREHGVPIITETAFAELFEEYLRARR